MPVIGFTINSVEAAREKNAPNAQVNINTSPNIKEIKEIDLDTFGKKVLLFEFDFTTRYSPSVGLIKISGELIYTAEDNKKILDAWEKKKPLPNDASAEILNFLFRRCILKILNLADDLQLPPPINLPSFKVQGQDGTNQNAEVPKIQRKQAGEEDDSAEKELKEKIKKLTGK